MPAKAVQKTADPKKAATPKPETTEQWKKARSHLFQSKPNSYGIGQVTRPKTDMTRYVKWPRMVRVQRQKAILQQRLKVPAAVYHFSNTLEKNAAGKVLELLGRYRPETKVEKKARLLALASAESKDQEASRGEKPFFIKHGINHVTELVENKKAKLVVIAHDVVPLELVLWLPTLCRQMDVPYCIIRGKSRLGQLVHTKTATAVAITAVRPKDNALLEQIIASVRIQYNDAPVSRKRGGGIMGLKHQHKVAKAARAAALEAGKIVAQ